LRAVVAASEEDVPMAGPPAALVSPDPFLTYNFLDQQRILALRYNLYQCWASEYTTLPELNSEANVVALASMTIEHEGWERDTSVTYTPGSTTQP
jgi:hypothetical protein